MARPRKDLKDLHDVEKKIRFTAETDKQIEEWATADDIPYAVLVRSIVVAAVCKKLMSKQAA